MEFQRQLEEARELTEARLRTFFSGGGLEEAMRYSLLAGGKRIRPILTMKFCEAAGGTLEEALDFGCGVEMLHTYSLIHDDLPCMDNDDLRRGMPTNHKKFGECVAILAGDALQAEAFRLISHAPGLSAEQRSEAVHTLASACGGDGMVAGQVLDMDGLAHDEASLRDLCLRKTGGLLGAAALLGCIAAGASDEVRRQALDYGSHLGLAFQVRDDMLDVISSPEELGKPVGSDQFNEKSTFVTALGLEGCAALVDQLTRQGVEALSGFDAPDFHIWLAQSLARRTK